LGWKFIDAAASIFSSLPQPFDEPSDKPYSTTENSRELCTTTILGY